MLSLWHQLEQNASCARSEIISDTDFHALPPYPLSPQAQGRLEDQRSRAPGPMDDEDFFSLLLRVQGGRMDEQRTELPCMLQTWEWEDKKPARL